MKQRLKWAMILNVSGVIIGVVVTIIYVIYIVSILNDLADDDDLDVTTPANIVVAP